MQKSFQLYKIDKIQDSEDSCLKFLSFLTLINFGFAVSKVIYVFSNKFYKKAFYQSFRIPTSADTSAASTIETQKLNLNPVAAAAVSKFVRKSFQSYKIDKIHDSEHKVPIFSNEFYKHFRIILNHGNTKTEFGSSYRCCYLAGKIVQKSFQL